MSMTNLIARFIEYRDNLEPKSYQPKADISSDIDIVTVSGISNRVPGSWKSISVEAGDTQIFDGNVIFMFDNFSDDDPYFHPVVKHPTVADLLQAMDNGIDHLKEDHHIHFEILEVLQDVPEYFTSPMLEDVKVPDLNDAVLINIIAGS